MPNIILINPLKNLGAFLTTICIYYPPFPNNQAIPSATKAKPMQNNQPVMGSNKTSNIPVPMPSKHKPIVFFSASNIMYYLQMVYNIKKHCEMWIFYVAQLAKFVI